MNQNTALVISVLLTVAFCSEAWSQKSSKKPAWGRSHHGSHYDEGPRAKPWHMEGIGKTHFPITTSHPDVQQWFDQGNTLLHGFWEFEAERAFRWCLKLDPDCAMAYWGLARCARGDDSRARRFFREAMKRKDSVSSRERAYLELWDAKYKIKGDKEKRNKAIKEYVKRFDNLLIDYPNDVEARALYWLEMLSATEQPDDLEYPTMRYGMDRVLKEVLEKEPDHVGALHYRVHNWDGEEGHYALETCLHLSKVAPQSGHLQHMPGHVLSSIGLWNEAAIAMDSATRVEKDYMRRRMVLPEQNWDYVHNLDYLCYIQEQLGMFDAAYIGATQMLSGPPNQEMAGITDFANWTMVRVLVKYEKWQEIIDLDSQLFNERGFLDEAVLAYARTQAFIGLGRLEEAEKQLKAFNSKVAILKSPMILGELFSKWFNFGQKSKASDDESDKDFIGEMIKIKHLELRGRLELTRGKQEKAIKSLKEAAELQSESWNNDPPRDPVFLFTALGEIYLDLGKHEEAVEAFEKTLEKVINDGFALSGLVVAHHELGQKEKAEKAMGRLQAVWRNADRPNRWLQKAEATGVRAAPVSNELHAERSYQEFVLDKKGHSLWSPPTAPELTATNAEGKKVSLENYRGKNVLLIFYLGGECLHCMEQMQAANRLAKEFNELNTEIVAVSKDDLETIKSYAAENFGVTLMSDPDFANARRFQSFDDFEEIELHSTLLIDHLGRVHWSSHGGDPFMDFDFLKNEVRRINERETEINADGQR